MTTFFDGVAKLSERELLDRFADLVARDRRTTAELLVAIAEIDERKLWAVHACSSMFTFCMERFHMSEQVTAKRIWAARTARRFPVILEMVERGELHLSAIHLLAKHLTEQNHARVLERAKHKSSREVERLVAELAPQDDVPSRIRALPGSRGAGASVDWPVVAGAALESGASSDGASSSQASKNNAPSGEASSGGASSNTDLGGGANDGRAPADGDAARRAEAARIPEPRTAAKPIVALSPRRYKIEITVDEATHDKLRSLQDLLARSGTGRDPAAIISRAIDVLLVRTLARKAACTDRPTRTTTLTTTTTATPTLKPATQPMPVKPTPATTTTATKGMPVTTTPAMQAMPTSSAIPTAFAMPVTPAKPARTDTCARKNTAADVASASRRQRSRAIPAAVRRAVWLRDSGRCCYMDARGRCCGETGSVEFHHKTPFALGGLSTPENIELRCAAHNQFQADLDFGRSFMDARRGTGTFPGECQR